MTGTEIVTLYLEPSLRESAEAGRHNFISKLTSALENARFRVEFSNLPAAGAQAGRGKTISHMKAPPDGEGLVFRRVYHYPFWQIENKAERWLWDVASQHFDPGQVDRVEAQRFFRFWQNRLFGEAPETAIREGFLYVPLQGRLLQHRSFQFCSPLEMLKHTAEQSNGKPIAAGLHPNEVYSANEIEALDNIVQTHPNITIHMGDMEELLKGCDGVVTQNSAAAFNGLFFGKPCVLFGKIDFHHIGLNVHDMGVERAFEALPNHAPDFACYVHWFWQERCINAGRPDVIDRISERLVRFGWGS